MSGHTSAALAETAAANYTAAQGTSVTVVDEFGITWNNVMVLGVTDISIQAVSTSVGGPANATHIVRARWLMRTTS